VWWIFEREEKRRATIKNNIIEPRQKTRNIPGILRETATYRAFSQ
jgi:hypothetical protein